VLLIVLVSVQRFGTIFFADFLAGCNGLTP